MKRGPQYFDPAHLIGRYSECDFCRKQFENSACILSDDTIICLVCANAKTKPCCCCGEACIPDENLMVRLGNSTYYCASCYHENEWKMFLAYMKENQGSNIDVTKCYCSILAGDMKCILCIRAKNSEG